VTDVRAVAGTAGPILVAVVLLGAFEMIVLPRRMTRRWQITVAVVRVSWSLPRAPSALDREQLPDSAGTDGTQDSQRMTEVAIGTGGLGPPGYASCCSR
jgi:hypothetical protein